MKRVIAVLALILTLGASTASASEVLDTDTGYGRAAVYAWSRGYHSVALVARYAGRADVSLRIHCMNGFTRNLSWTDYGPRFRVIRSVPTYVRCNYAGVLTTNGSYIRLVIGAF
jgi:hypothetical protein